MRYSDLNSFVRSEALAKGPVALIFVEDGVEVESTLRLALARGFRQVAAFMPPSFKLAPEFDEISRVDFDALAEGAVIAAINACIDAAPGVWFHYCYNAEYLFYPFAESRSVGEMLQFVTEERRQSVLTYVVDLYAADLGSHPSAVSIETAHLDKSGYYALARKDAWNNTLDRQMDFYGGLRWRFEEHIPKVKRRIDRASLFQAEPGLRLLADHTLSVPEMNTFACPWHHSLTAAVASFRTAKALKRNPGSTFEIPSFHWHNSAPFEWQSQQLLELGLMEPGQWF